MEHILNDKAEEIDYPRYHAYVESIKEKLPPHVYSFASNSSYFDLTSHSSLHDAWLESVNIREVATGERHEIRRLEITICLLGPFHDRHIHLRYSGVSTYSFSAPSRRENPRFDHVAHGDLLTHEIRLGRDGMLVHELLFERNGTFLIESADIRHSEELIK
jgi:hypothetical protein